jgi:uncharacterized iron-regulated protein
VRAGVFIDEAQLLGELTAVRFVLLGERHDHPEHHQLQAAIVRRLAARGRRPAVAFEMLSADVAESLAEATSAAEPTPQTLRHAVDWDASGWPDFGIYEPVFAAALAARLPFAAADLPAGSLAQVRDDGLAGLDAGMRATLHLDTAVPAAQRTALAAAIVSGHCGHLPDSAVPRLVDVQLARDAYLAHAVESAAAEGDGAVLIAGAGHVRRDWAVPYWLERRAPGTSVTALAFVEAAPAQRDPGPGAERYDFVWYTAPVDDEDPCEKYRERLEALEEKLR